MAGRSQRYGDPIVAACLRAGTPNSHRSRAPARHPGLIGRYHADADAKRVRIVNFCGASSVPAELRFDPDLAA